MRVRSALRVVALVSTLAGLVALPSPASAATKKPAAKSAKKSSASRTSNAKGKTASASKSKSSTAKASTAKASPPKASPAKGSSGASAKNAAYDPVAPTTSIPAAPAATASASAPPQRGPTRIDFDDRLIQGQTNRSGAVYLYDRKELKQRSMIKKRETFREEIVGAVYDSEL
jgi:hypothetical protein